MPTTLDSSYLQVSDRTGDAVLMHVTENRLAAATTLKVDSVVRVPQKFIATTGTVNASGFIDTATKTDFYGHLSGSDIIIDGFCPGSTDTGNTVGQVVVIKPNTAWADLVADLVQHPSDWSAISDSMAYASVDGPTGVITVPTGARSRYSLGKRLKFDQVQALTSYWSMDSSSADTKGANTGTDTSMTYTSGKFSNAATFNGTTSKIVITDAASLKPTGPFTLGLWFKTSNTGTQMLFHSYSQNTNIAGFRLWITGNKLDVTIGKNTGTGANVDYIDVQGTTTVTDGNWHYVVVTFQNNFVQIYLDGNLEAFSSTPGAPGYAATNYVRIGCGNNSGSDSNFMNGQIDDVFLINGYALDEAWIAAKYAASTAQTNADLTLTKMAIITKVADTAVTAFFGTDYALANSAITNLYISGLKTPSGFPANPNKWTITVFDVNDRTISSAVSGTWTNLATLGISVPIGVWRVWYEVVILCRRLSAGTTSAETTLGTTSGAVGDTELTTYTEIRGDTDGSALSLLAQVHREKVVDVSAKTQYYFNIKTAQSGNETLGVVASTDTKSVVKAVSAYL